MQLVRADAVGVNAVRGSDAAQPQNRTRKPARKASGEKGVRMYIGGGVIVVILIIVLLMLLL